MSLSEENRAWLHRIRGDFAELPLGELANDGTVAEPNIDEVKLTRMQVAQAAANLITAIKVYEAAVVQASDGWIARQQSIESSTTELAQALEGTTSTAPTNAAAELAARAQQVQTSVLPLSLEITDMLSPLTELEDTLDIRFTEGTVGPDPLAQRLDGDVGQTILGREQTVAAIDRYLEGDAN